MATFYGTQAALGQLSPPSAGGPGQDGAVTYVKIDSFTFAAQASGSTLAMFRSPLPLGAKFLYGRVVASDVTSYHIKIGIAGTLDKYMVDAALTTANVPQTFGITASLNTALLAAENIIITTGTASLPASGTLVLEMYYTMV